MNLFRIFLSATNFCFDMWEPCAVKESAVRREHSWSPQMSIRGQSHLLLQLLISQQHIYTYAEQTYAHECLYLHHIWDICHFIFVYKFNLQG